MYLIYSFLLLLGFLLMSPLFLLRREKYASGFKQRLGNYPAFDDDGRKVIWLHCVSVGETNAARPLVDQLLETFQDHRLIISTTTKTGQDLARKIFGDKTDAVIFFPFDWKFSVRKALDNYKPSLVLLMETEIWPRLIREAKLSGAKVVIVNGRLSERSSQRYSKIRSFMKNVLKDVDLALMQSETDANRISLIGMDPAKVFVTGNLKFDVGMTEADIAKTEYIRDRFGINGELPLVVAASTHDPEERWILESLDGEPGNSCRLLIAPRHPERFQSVVNYLRNRTDYHWVRRSAPQVDSDKNADVILLDSLGELRAVYPLADIVFVGGSLIPHGGQSILEPASVGKAMVTGSHTHNFSHAIRKFRANDALIQLPELPIWEIESELFKAFSDLLTNADRRTELGKNAAAVMNVNRGATVKTVDFLSHYFPNTLEAGNS